MKTFALFDFCETLVTFQSIPEYLRLVGFENPRFKHTSFQRRFFPRLYRYSKIPLFSYKFARYEELKGFDTQRAKVLAAEYTHDRLLPHVNPKVIQKLKFHQDRGDEIVIVSGGLEIYIKEFAKHFDIKHVIAVALEEKNNLLTGNIDGIHTMEHRKLYKLAQYFDLKNYDLPHSYAYSDCSSDIPLLSLVGNGVAIECGKDLQWAKILGYEIL